jgi:hypothetical protein
MGRAVDRHRGHGVRLPNPNSGNRGCPPPTRIGLGLLSGDITVLALYSVPNYDITPNCQRFIMVSENALGTDEGFAVIIVTNWFEELRQRMGN